MISLCKKQAVSVAVVAGLAAASAGAQSGTAPSPKVHHEWTMRELLPVVSDLGTGRNWAAGRDVFRKTGCGLCHALGREFILQSILEPSATINGRFFHTTFTLKNGDVVTGSVIDVSDKTIVVAPVMMNPQATVAIAEGDVKKEEPSAVSPMPSGLLNELSKEEIIELMAFLDAGGDRTASIYTRK